MEWGVIEWTSLVLAGTTISGILGKAYLNIVKSNVHTSEKIENGFDKLNEIEKTTSRELHDLKIRLSNKADKIQTLETMLFDYLKKHEADKIYVKKDIIEPKMENLHKNQTMIYEDLKDFRDDFKKSVAKITGGLEKHIETDMQFQKDMLVELKNIAQGKNNG